MNRKKGNTHKTDRKKLYTSKYISLILRHKPEEIGITLDKNGWADVKKLLKGVKITMDELEDIVDTDEKCRYSFNEDKTLIRANQGHSVPVDVELEKIEPPEFLWHGTGEKSVDAIMEEGIKPMSRLYVHLSADEKTAVKVGKRHGKPVVFKIASGKMFSDGIEFFKSANGIYLVKKVPPEYIKPVQ